jgi:hypothetical protein
MKAIPEVKLPVTLALWIFVLAVGTTGNSCLKEFLVERAQGDGPRVLVNLLLHVFSR